MNLFRNIVAPGIAITILLGAGSALADKVWTRAPKIVIHAESEFEYAAKLSLNLFVADAGGYDESNISATITRQGVERKLEQIGSATGKSVKVTFKAFEILRVVKPVGGTTIPTLESLPGCNLIDDDRFDPKVYEINIFVDEKGCRIQ